MHVTSVRYSWNIQGIFLHSIFPEHYLGIFPGNFFWIFWEYIMGILHKYSTNIYLAGGVVWQIFWSSIRAAFLPYVYQQQVRYVLSYYVYHHNAHLCSAKTFLGVLGRKNRILRHCKYPSARTLTKWLANRSHFSLLSYLALLRCLLLTQLWKWHFVFASIYLATIRVSKIC